MFRLPVIFLLSLTLTWISCSEMIAAPISLALKHKITSIQGCYSFYGDLKKRMDYHLIRNNEDPEGCTESSEKPPHGRWMALVESGGCEVIDKINIAIKNKASGILIYGTDLIDPIDPVLNVSVLYTTKSTGIAIGNLFTNETEVWLKTSRNCEHKRQEYNKTVNVLSAFTLLVMILLPLQWYVKRLQVKNQTIPSDLKLLLWLPAKYLNAEDFAIVGEEEKCPVCLEPFKIAEKVRCMPCDHMFHIVCIDMWLLENGSCPMCKFDLLAKYRTQILKQEDVAEVPPAVQEVPEVVEDDKAEESTSGAEATE